MKTHPITLPAFGQPVPGQGGVFVAVMRGHTVDGVEQPPYALLAAPAGVGEFEGIEWGNYGKEIEGAASRRDGLANTEAMAKANCPAALKVREVKHEGHRDYYLASLGEFNSAAANTPELFEKDGWYWTSTQRSRGSAFAHDFKHGFSVWYGKSFELRVRAFRRIPLELLNP